MTASFFIEDFRIAMKTIGDFMHGTINVFRQRLPTEIYARGECGTMAEISGRCPRKCCHRKSSLSMGVDGHWSAIGVDGRWPAHGDHVGIAGGPSCGSAPSAAPAHCSPAEARGRPRHRHTLRQEAGEGDLTPALRRPRFGLSQTDAARGRFSARSRRVSKRQWQYGVPLSITTWTGKEGST